MTAADTPAVEPALSRRSRRVSQATPQATAPVTRAELRRRLLAQGVEVPSVVATGELEAIADAAVEVAPAQEKPAVRSRREERIAAVPRAEESRPPADSAPVEAVALRRRDRRRPLVHDEATSTTAVLGAIVADAAKAEEAVPDATLEVSIASAAPHADSVEQLPASPADGTHVDVVEVAELPLVDDAPGAAHDDADPDAFQRAAETFRFDGVVPPIKPAPPLGSSVVVSEPSRRLMRFRRVTTVSASLGVLGVVGALAVSMTTPALAVGAQPAATNPALTAMTTLAEGEWGTDFGPEGVDEGEIQAFVASEDVQNVEVTRVDDFEVASSRQAAAQLAADSGIRYSTSLYTNDTSASIQWPFAVGVAMSSPYGMRWGRLHAGIDLVPGNGAPIQAIADGTVRVATENGGAYGVNVYIDHEIDGRMITSHYAHMQYGSLQVRAGDKVKVGDIIGRTGNTGRSYGAHLHFEILINGKQIDPLPWMKEHAGRHDD